MLTLFLVLVAILLISFAMGFHVAVTLGLAAVIISELFSSRSLLGILSTIPWNAINSTTLVALPLFVLMGEILLRNGVTEGMYQSLSRWLNRLPRGLFRCSGTPSSQRPARHR